MDPASLDPKTLCGKWTDVPPQLQLKVKGEEKIRYKTETNAIVEG